MAFNILFKAFEAEFNELIKTKSVRLNETSTTGQMHINH